MRYDIYIYVIRRLKVKGVSFALGNNICEVQNLVLLVYYSVSTVKQVMTCQWIVKQSKKRWTAFKTKYYHDMLCSVPHVYC